MRVSRTSLHGRRGWSAVAGLATVLTVLVAGQLPAAADAAPLAPLSSALDALVPSAAPAAGLSPVPAAAPSHAARVAGASAGQRLASAAGPVRAAAAPAAATPPAAKPAAVKATAVKPAAAQPAASLCSGSGWQQRRGQAALASLKGGAARTGFRVEFAGARKGYLGLTHLEERRIEVFVRACGTQSDELLRHVVAHELGHAYDTTHMTTATRRAWMAARGIPAGTDWYGCSGCTDFATPAGDFARSTRSGAAAWRATAASSPATCRPASWPASRSSSSAPRTPAPTGAPPRPCRAARPRRPARSRAAPSRTAPRPPPPA
jgi:hypothetical protein